MIKNYFWLCSVTVTVINISIKSCIVLDDNWNARTQTQWWAGQWRRRPIFAAMEESTGQSTTWYHKWKEATAGPTVKCNSVTRHSQPPAEWVLVVRLAQLEQSAARPTKDPLTWYNVLMDHAFRYCHKLPNFAATIDYIHCSVASERVLSLSGYIVNRRRNKL
jgi:hypothetical protein